MLNGMLTSMLNWYRANFDIVDGIPAPKAEWNTPVTVDVPTLVLWGEKDTALLTGNLVGLDDYVETLEIKKYPNANHWVIHQEGDLVVEDIRTFAASLE